MRVVHKGKRDKNFDWVAHTLCSLGAENRDFTYTKFNKKVTCEKCLRKLKRGKKRVLN